MFGLEAWEAWTIAIVVYVGGVIFTGLLTTILSEGECWSDCGDAGLRGFTSGVLVVTLCLGWIIILPSLICLTLLASFSIPISYPMCKVFQRLRVREDIKASREVRLLTTELKELGVQKEAMTNMVSGLKEEVKKLLKKEEELQARLGERGF